MKKTTILFGLSLYIIFGLQMMYSQSNTKRANKLIESTKFLEDHPFGKNSKILRNKALKYVYEADASEILVAICKQLTDLIDDNYKYKGELTAQYTIGMAAFKLKNHPRDIKNEFVIQKAGILSMLKTYESILNIEPAMSISNLDDLINKRESKGLISLIERISCFNKDDTKKKAKNNKIN